jgi:hypothetical protein
MPPTVAAFGQDYLLRAVIARYGFGANQPKYATYPSASVDGDGDALDGARRSYTLALSPLPPVEPSGFWSVTMYDSETQLLVCNDYANGTARYSVSSVTPGLVASAADGSVTLVLSNAPPATPDAYANWLPAPAGKFNVIMRLYNPQPQVGSGDWTPNAIAKA